MFSHRGQSCNDFGVSAPPRTANSVVLLTMSALALLAAAVLYAGAWMANDHRIPLLILPFTAALVAFGASCVIWLSRFSHRTRLMLFAIAIVSIDLGLANQQLQGITLATKGFCYVLLLASSVFMLGSQHERRQIGCIGALVVAYALLSWVTILFSYDRITTAYTGFGLFTLALGGFSIARDECNSAIEAARVIRDLVAVLILVSLVVVPFAPGFVIASGVGTGRLSGFFGGPNALGAVAAIGALLVFAGNSRRTGNALYLSIASVQLLIFVVALILSGSRTSFLALVLSIGAVMLVRWPARAVAAAAGIIASAFVVAFSMGSKWADVFLSAVSRQGDGRDLTTLTGRLPLWERLFHAWLESPWMGYGLGGSRRLIEDVYITRWGQTFQSAHNAWLESLLNVGFIGTALLLAAIVGLGGRLMRLALGRDPETIPAVALSTGLLCFCLLHGITEKSFAGTPSIATGALILAIALASASRQRRAETT